MQHVMHESTLEKATKLNHKGTMKLGKRSLLHSKPSTGSICYSNGLKGH